MSYIQHDCNNEQFLLPITIIRGGTSRGFYFEKRNVPKPGKGLEQFLLAVRGSPDPMGMDGLGGNTVLQSKAAIVSPSSRPDADVDYTFAMMYPDDPGTICYNCNCGNISSGVPVFALMKNMLPGIKDGLNEIRVYSTNSKKMMYVRLEVLNGEALVHGDCEIGGQPGTGAKVMVDFRDQGGAFTEAGELFPTGNLVDTIKMEDGSRIDVTITDMVNPSAFFNPTSFGAGCTGLELPSPDGSLREPPGMLDRISELRWRVAQLLGWEQYDKESIRHSSLPFAVSVTGPADYTTLQGTKIKASEVDLVARFYAIDIMHTAAPGSASACLAAAVAVPGTIPAHSHMSEHRFSLCLNTDSHLV